MECKKGSILIRIATVKHKRLLTKSFLFLLCEKIREINNASYAEKEDSYNEYYKNTEV